MEQIVTGLFYLVFAFGLTIFVFVPKLYSAVRTGELKTRKATYRYTERKGMFVFLVTLLALGSAIVIGTAIYVGAFFLR